MVGLNTLTSGDSVSELSDAVSIARLQSAASSEWTRTHSASATELGSARQKRSLPRREVSFNRERQDRLSCQAVFENDTERGFDEASEATTVETSTLPTNAPTIHNTAISYPSSSSFDANTTELFGKTESDFNSFDLDAERYNGPSAAETELTAKLQELKELQSTAAEDDKRPDGVASVATMQHSELKQDEDFTASSKNSSIHIPELDDLDRTLSLADADSGDDDD